MGAPTDDGNAGPDAPAPPSGRLPRTGRYRVERRLGAGGMGVVYEAFDPLLERRVALKFLPARLADDPAARDRMLHEARALAALDHPNVGTVHDVDVGEDGQPFLVLALYRGATLAQRLVPVPWREAVAWVVDVARGVAHAHQSGVVHGDVKPANLLVTREGVVKLLDFGLAAVADPGALEARGLGTLEYMAPEVLGGARPTPASDVWSLAVVLYELLTGVGPFRAEALGAGAVVRRVMEEEPPRPSSIDRSVPAAFDAVLTRALSRAEHARTSSAAVFAQELEAAAAAAAAAEAADAADPSRPSPRNADRPTTPFIGRGEELSLVRACLSDGGQRGVLLHGLPGVGKSRLALEAALDAAGRGACAGVVVAHLGDCQSADEIPLRIADALGLPTPTADAWRAIAAGIADASTLLLLDDVDRLAPGWNRLSRLLDACSGLQVLAIARARFDIPGFRAVPLAGLSVPPEGTVAASDAEAYEAVQLFVDVARRTQPSFGLDAATTPAVAALCRHAAGLPLAIEVVAPLVRAMPVAALAASLGEGLDVLSLATPDGGSTLGAALAQSWSHLDREARALAERIAVFEGSFDWAAARTVADASVTSLGRLVDGSLLAFGADGRYRMHPLTRRFARARLDPASRGEAQGRHGRHVLGLLAGLAAALRGPDQGSALAEVARGIADVEVAWRWAAAGGEAALLVRCADPLRLFYDRRGQVRHGAAVLAAAEVNPVVAVHLAWLLMLSGDAGAAADRAAVGLAALPDDAEVIHAVTGWSTLGAVAAGRGDLADAEMHFARALALAERRGDDALAARCLDNLGSVAEAAGQVDDAQRHYERGLALARRSANEAQVAVTLSNLGTLHLHAGRVEASVEALEAALEIARRYELERALPVVLVNLAEASRAVGRAGDGMRYADEAARRARRLGDARIEAAGWTEFGRIAAARGSPEEARAAFRRAVAAGWGAGDRGVTVAAVRAWAEVEANAGHQEVARRWRAASGDDAAFADGAATGSDLTTVVAEMLGPAADVLSRSKHR